MLKNALKNVKNLNKVQIHFFVDELKDSLLLYDNQWKIASLSCHNPLYKFRILHHRTEEK